VLWEEPAVGERIPRFALGADLEHWEVGHLEALFARGHLDVGCCLFGALEAPASEHGEVAEDGARIDGEIHKR